MKTLSLLMLGLALAGCAPQTAEQRETTAMLLNALVGMQQAEALRSGLTGTPRIYPETLVLE